MTVRPRLEFCLDTCDREPLVEFWTQALGYVRGDANETYVELLDPTGNQAPLVLQTVPEGRGGKNRAHLDLYLPDGEWQEHVARVIALGATRVRDTPSYTVLQDPEGNEFCVCRDERPATASG